MPSPFPCSPVIRKLPWKKSQTNKTFLREILLKLLLDHSFSMYPKFSEKLTFLSCWHAHVIIVIAIIATAVVVIIIIINVIIISIIVIIIIINIIIIITLLLIYYMLTKNRIQASVSLQRQELNIK